MTGSDFLKRQWEETMLRRIALTLGVTALMAGAALADPIEGNYRTPKTGSTAKVAACGSSFCMTYTSGQFNGKQFARFKATGGGSYAGTLTDYTDGGKEYTGKAKLVGNDIKVSGCILGGLLCQSEIFKRL
jgi:uncharacterized protein (DUF2147 family)